ncbi:SET domain-containing protein 9-like [Clytia hemisphaerica]|uniref:SET domain-containing protein 9-like n=1 Tax=Clytia hemisphaerica TaxID=252671 RepID=UPI0034D5C4A5
MKIRIFKKWLASIKSYSYRSTPWLLLTWKKRSIKQVSKSENSSFTEKEPLFLSQLQELFLKLQQNKNGKLTPSQVMEQSYGFSIEIHQSTLPNAGLGVYVKSGTVPKYGIASMYPGTIYYPMEPIFFQSIKNPYILKCVDGIMVDGNHQGISKKVFRSCSLRDHLGVYPSCDTSWLNAREKQTINPLAIGQIVNNAPIKNRANVVYQELDIPYTFPTNLRQYLPNVRFKPMDIEYLQYADEKELESLPYIRVIVLVALRDIHAGEELFSSYFTEVEYD